LTIVFGYYRLLTMLGSDLYFKSVPIFTFKLINFMIEVSRKILTTNWLQKKLINHEHGIVFDDANFSSFALIQNFIEANDHPFQTPAIYYEAFPEESAAELIATLKEELTAKLGNPKLHLNKSLSDIVATVGLQMIIIDRSHLHPIDTLEDLLEQFMSCNVCLILVACYSKINIAQLLSHPAISQWEMFVVNNESEMIPEIC